MRQATNTPRKASRRCSRWWPAPAAKETGLNLLVKADRAGKPLVDVTPASAGWTHVGFRAVKLAAGEHEVWQQSGRECCVVILAGKASVQVGDTVWAELGQRDSVFDEQAPYAVYAPPGLVVTVTADS
ncbi:MAG: 5-deoxy-glucuronate isomerase, partial [Vogesella sp.]|uniref:5-deoxy-glucuronate isomerase n=1 Tax=Vogesella sp. TaxID=1904252 RepID=UPI003F3903CD